MPTLLRLQRSSLLAGVVTLYTLAAGLIAQDTPDDPSRELYRLFDDYHAWEKQESPGYARSLGDYSHADRIRDESLEAIDRRHRDRVRFLARLRAIPRDQLDDDGRLNAELFAWQLESDIEEHQHRFFLAPIGSRSGPHLSIAEMHERSRFQSVQDYEDFLTRLDQAPAWVDATIERLRRGVEEGRTAPRIVLGGVPEQFDSLLRDGLEPLASPFDRWPESVTPEQRTALRARFDERAMPAIRAALRKLGDYVRDEYIGRCRESIAAHDWPDGQAAYAHRLREMTTTRLSAREIHELGLSEVARIRAEMMSVIRRSDFLELHPAARDLSENDLFRGFIDYLRNDPRFYHDTPEALLIGYRDICKRVDPHLPRLFGHLPQLPYGVREIPAFMAPTQTTAYYSPGNMKSGEAGYFFANTYKLDQRPKYEMIALSLHEAVPGHHLQIAIAQELESVPEFRKNMWITAYGEGWALYSERLGIEMGLYEDPYDDFGRLLYEMWRACRLVVDPGMHALGWTRDQAIRFMLDNTALSELNITNEVDRYIGWPGQACGYKIGELKIRELRARGEERLGERFNLRAFHDLVLGAGPLPLDVLESRVDAWIDAHSTAGK